MTQSNYNSNELVITFEIICKSNYPLNYIFNVYLYVICVKIDCKKQNLKVDRSINIFDRSHILAKSWKTIIILFGSFFLHFLMLHLHPCSNFADYLVQLELIHNLVLNECNIKCQNDKSLCLWSFVADILMNKNN